MVLIRNPDELSCSSRELRIYRNIRTTQAHPSPTGHVCAAAAMSQPCFCPLATVRKPGHCLPAQRGHKPRVILKRLLTEESCVIGLFSNHLRNGNRPESPEIISKKPRKVVDLNGEVRVPATQMGLILVGRNLSGGEISLVYQIIEQKLVLRAQRLVDFEGYF